MRDWRIAHVRSVLGAALTGQDKYADAEPLLLAGYSQMRDAADSIPDELREARLREALERIVKLYESWGKPDKAAEYRASLSQGVNSEATAPTGQ